MKTTRGAWKLPGLGLRLGPRYHRDMSSETLLDREEYIEQAYLFRVMRDRLGSNFAAQEILDHVH